MRTTAGYLARRGRTGSLPRPCKWCGETYSPRYGRTQGLKFCSAKCYYAWNHERPLHVRCEQCGKAFRRTAALVRRVRHTFCDSECFRLFHSRRESPMFRGGRETTGTRRGWPKLAEAIRQRDGFCCRFCGKTQKENGRRLSVDHVIPRRLFENKAEADDPKNLAAVCLPCHSKKTSRAEQRYLRGDVLDFRRYVQTLRIAVDNFTGTTPGAACS